MFGINKLKRKISSLEIEVAGLRGALSGIESFCGDLERDLKFMNEDVLLLKANQHSDEHDWFVEGVGYLRKMKKSKQNLQAGETASVEVWHFRPTCIMGWIPVNDNRVILDALREIEEEGGD